MTEGPSTFGLRITSEGRRWTVHLEGELDATQAETLSDAAQALCECQLQVVDFDLVALTFLDIAGYHAVLAAAALITASGALVRVSHDSAAVRRITSLWELAAA